MARSIGKRRGEEKRCDERDGEEEGEKLDKKEGRDGLASETWAGQLSGPTFWPATRKWETSGIGVTEECDSQDGNISFQHGDIFFLFA